MRAAGYRAHQPSPPILGCRPIPGGWHSATSDIWRIPDRGWIVPEQITPSGRARADDADRDNAGACAGSEDGGADEYEARQWDRRARAHADGGHHGNADARAPEPHV